MTASGKATLAVLALVLLVAAPTANAYTLYKNYDGTSANFFDNFAFWQDVKGTPEDTATHSYVYYTTKQQAHDWGLTWTSPQGAYIKPDTTTVSTGYGRASVRMQTTDTFNYGLFLIDIYHMPYGCGTWPSIWMTNDPWPYKGEIDIIEGVNLYVDNKSTLHTSIGCTMDHVSTTSFTGYWDPQGNTNCNGSMGCGIFNNKNDWGQSLNNRTGGVYAVEWTSSGIKMWFFWRDLGLPSDIVSGNPTPGSWGTPYANFQFGSDCSASHFADQAIIVNLAFCGAWPVGDWQWSPCQNMGLGNCTYHVQNHPGYFSDAYFLIKSIKVYT